MESDLLGCVSYVHSDKLLGAPKFDDVEIVEEVVEMNNGEGFKIETFVEFLFGFMFLGLLFGVLGIVLMTYRGRLKSERARERKHRHSSQVHLNPGSSQRNSTTIPSQRNSTTMSSRTASTSDPADNRVSVHYSAKEDDQKFVYKSWGLEMKEDSL